MADRKACRIAGRTLVIMLGLPMASAMTPANAAQWNLDRRLIVGVLHSDNPDQLDDESKRGETVGQLKPTLSLFRRGKRSDLLLLSELEYLRSDSDDEDALRPRVFSSLASTVVENRLFFDTSVEVARASTGAGNVVFDSLNLNGEQDTTYDVKVGPRAEVELNPLTDLSLDYTFNAFVAEGDEIRDSTTSQAALDIRHDRSDRGYELGSTLSYEHSDIDDQEPLVERYAATSASVALSSFWQAEGTLGREWTQVPLQTAAAGEPETFEENGTVWDVGLTWKPTARTSLSAGYGRRFYGERPRVELTHSTRHARFSLSWSRDLSRSRAVLADPDFPVVSGDPSGSLAGGSTDEALSSPRLERVVNEIAVEEQVRADYRLLGRVSELRLEALYTRQDLEFQSADTNAYDFSVRTSLTRRLGKITSVTASYQHTNGDSESRFHENRVRLALTLDLQ